MEINPNMEKIQFACFMNRLQKSINVELDTDLIAKIYSEYTQTYDNYGLFEIYNLLKTKNIKITTYDMNWYTLIDIAKKNNIQPKNIKDSIMDPQWYLMRDRMDIFSITLVFPKFEIIQYDIIEMPDGFKYDINEIYLTDDSVYATDDDDAIRDNCMICLENLNTGDFIDVNAYDFMYALNCQDIQYIQSNWLDYVNK